MGWLFKTPSDDATEATLRALHTQNLVDTVYERTLGWVKVVLFTVGGVFTTSAVEHYTDISVWEDTIEWARLKVMDWLGL
jgi:hypothetical protein